VTIPKTNDKAINDFNRDTQREVENLKSLIAKLTQEVNKIKSDVSKLKAGG
jgi:hypothetical protein